MAHYKDWIKAGVWLINCVRNWRDAFVRRSLAVFVLYAAFGADVHCVQAQGIFPPAVNEKKLRVGAVYTTEKIDLDGRLTEKAWRDCPVTTPFVVMYPDQGKVPSEGTEIRILYDSAQIYVGVVCHYHGGKKSLQVQDMRRDFAFSNNELIEVVINPFCDPRSPVTAFCVSPFGTLSDILYYHDGTNDYDWDALWQAKCTIEDSAWVAEIAIPFSTLRYPARDSTWSINFSRIAHSEGEQSVWSPVPLAFSSSRAEYAGLLTGIHPPPPKVNLRVEPYALIESTRTSPVAGAPIAGKLSTKPEGGGEIKWAVNTNTLLEGTINTDFSQADVDLQVVNLTRSAVFFPEKRQFFKENANLFAVGQDGVFQPFFSRTIGLNALSNPIPIDGGLRIIHQSAKEAAGLLLMRQEGDSVDNPAWFNVLRYKRNFGKDLQVGGMSILRYNEPTARDTASLNAVGVVDAFWKISQPLFLRGLASFSEINRGGVSNPEKSGGQPSGSGNGAGQAPGIGNSGLPQKGQAALMEMGYVGNTVYADLLETYVSKSYSAQSGYLARQDFINTLPYIQLLLKDARLPHYIAFYNPQLNASIFHQASTGTFQEATVSLLPLCFVFRDFGQVDLTIIKAWENLDSVFSPVTSVNILPGNYVYSTYQLHYLSNQGAHYSVEARVSTGGYYNGWLNTYYISLRAAPIPHISLLVNYTRNDFRGMGPAKTSATTGKASATTHLLAPQLRLALNPRITLSTLYQYNTDASTGTLNCRFAWEYRPLSFVYFVYNSLEDVHTQQNAMVTGQQAGILKISYIRQL
jgi:hypothetical protein